MNARREAKQLGLAWSHVLQCARELRRHAIEKREALDGARRCAWQIYCHFHGRSEGCHSFWRCGFDHVLGALGNKGHDYTAIRAYDVIADAVADHFPEWRDQGSELWDWLSSPYERLPRTEQFITTAIDTLARSSSRNEVPF